MRYNPNFDRYHCDHLLEKYEKLISNQNHDWMHTISSIWLLLVFKFRSTYMRSSIYGIQPFSCKINTCAVRCKDSHWFQALTALSQDTTKLIPVQAARGTLCPRKLQVSEINESRQYHVVSTHSTLTIVSEETSLYVWIQLRIYRKCISHTVV